MVHSGIPWPYDTTVYTVYTVYAVDTDNNAEEYSEPRQTSKMEYFVKIHSILDVSQGSGNAFVMNNTNDDFFSFVFPKCVNVYIFLKVPLPFNQKQFRTLSNIYDGSFLRRF